ncbi:MAG: pilus assembly protein [Lysobacterales bacterium]
MKNASIATKMGLLLGLAASCFTSGQAWAQLDIANQPLVVFQNVKSNVIVVLDDSGSMSFETITPTNDGSLYWQGDNTDSFVDNTGTLFFGTAGDKYSYVFPFTEGPNGGHYVFPPFPQFAFMRSAAYNNGYYDPTQTYEPWPDFGAQVFNDIDPTVAPSDPSGSTGNSGRLHNLTSDFEFTNEGFHFQRDMVIPDGTRYRNGANNGWITQAGDAAWGNGRQERGIDYYPAFYYTPVDTGTYTITIVPPVTIPPVAPTVITGSCDTPVPANYKLFERAPSALGAVTGTVDALGPDGSCLVRTAIGGGTPEMQNFANWFSYYRKRHLSVRNGIVGAFVDLPLGMNVGYFTINNRNTVNMREFDNNPAIDERDLFLADIVGENFGGGTPNRDALNHAGRQFERTTNPVVEFECQKNFAVMFTDGFSVTNGPNVGNVDGGEGAPYADGFGSTIADIAMDYYENFDASALAFPPENTGLVSIPRDCDTATLPTPLDCNTDLHMNTYMVVLNGTGTIFNVTYNEVEDAYTTPPTWPNTNGNRDPSQIDDLYHAAVNGRGLMLNAATPTEIAERFQTALADIVARSRPTTALTATSTRLTTASRLYQAAFDSFDWSGDLVALNLSGGNIWSAEEELKNRTAERVVYTTNDSGGVLFDDFTDLSTATQTAVTASLDSVLGVDLGSGSPAFNANQFIDFIKGDDTLEGAPLRERDNVLGDIVNSEPIVSGPGNEGWNRLPAGEGGGSAYVSYVDGPKFTRPLTVFVGANDGMLHAFNAEDGAELFGFVPRTVIPKLPELGNPDYLHEFYVDDTPTVADAYNGSWRTVLVGGLGAGGRGLYALDVTNPNAFNASNILWEFNSDDDPDLGLTFGRPIITRTADGTWVAIINNGHNSQNNDGFLFVFDLFNGNLLAKIATEQGSNANPAGLGSPRLEISGDGGLSVASVYAGDLQGNMWKFDLSDPSPSNWRSAFLSGGDPQPLFIARDRNGVRQPITAAPTLVRNPSGDVVVYFGTGKFFEKSDATVSANPQLRTFYTVVEDRPDLDPLADFNIGSPGTRADLVDIRLQQEFTDSGFVVRRFDPATIPGRLGTGWFIDLALDVANPTGERVVATPRVEFGTLLFTTFEPTNTPCLPGGIPRLYILDAFSGEAALTTTALTCTDCVGLELTTGAPLVPPVVIDQTGEEQVQGCYANPSDPGCFCILNPGDASCASEPDDPILSSCDRGSRPVVIIDPVTRSKIVIGCTREGRARWGQKESY